MLGQSGDHEFDQFRRDRKRQQSRLVQGRATNYANDTLRELEEVEQREMRDQQLTREVHEFFATATRQAAGIVERVAKDAQEAAGEKIEQEMESFLIDALARMNTFVLTVLQQRRQPIAEQRMEPKVGNLLGGQLDEFRWAGTADLGDKHIGQDPFAIDLEQVQREFREATGGTVAPTAPVEDHLAERLAGVAEPAPAAAAAPASGMAEPAVTPSVACTVQPATATTPAEDELERFKAALKTLVRQGTMSREEAKAAWQTRLAARGLTAAPAVK